MAFVYRPPHQSSKAPVAVYVHGGGWVIGTTNPHGYPFGSLPESIVFQLLGRGITVIWVNYQGAFQAPWPAELQDVKCAIRSIRANARSLQVDPNRIVAIGDSAGGHLVNLLGTMPHQAGADVGQYLNESSTPNAVVDLFGPADLTAGDWAETPSTQTIQRVFGTLPTLGNPQLVAASPVTYIRHGDPPFLVVQGTSDTQVPFTQAEEFARDLRSNGVAVTLVLVQHAEHELQPTSTPMAPSLSVVLSTVTAFVVTHAGANR
jgi:acetyl esterase/lipase